jgi:hypothetical protein
MTFDQFRRLVRAGEKATVDFKLLCNAFNKGAGDHEKAKAELVKDICAMANNGGQASYLIVGVANDGKSFQSISDPNLTPANIQTLVRDSIHPRPFVRVHQCCWAKVPKPFAGIRFVVIQIGPNAKAAYRFAKDYIQDGSKYCFRKHQVWVRNEDTSDVATPEQIVALSTRRVKAELDPGLQNTHYEKLALREQIPALRDDLRKLFDQLGYKISLVPCFKRIGLNGPSDEFRVSIPLRGKRFVFRCCIRHSMTRQLSQAVEVVKSWNLEHGLLVFLTGALANSAKFTSIEVDFTAAWGNFNLLKPAHVSLFWAKPNILRGFSEGVVCTITLPKIKDSLTLRQATTAMLDALQDDDQLFEHANRARMEINRELKRWGSMAPDVVRGAWPSYRKEEMNGFRKSMATVLGLLEPARRHEE